MSPPMLSCGLAVLVAAASAGSACSRRDPPTPDASPSIALPEFPPRIAITTATATALGLTPSPSLSASTAPVPAPAPSRPATDASDPSLLPQTHDRPDASGADFHARVVALWSGIVADDPERAMPFFFPLGAYEQVKDIGNPVEDWRRRLVAAYSHDIHALHQRLGDSASTATLTGLDVPDGRARWVDPGEEYNKLGYFRVFGSKLRFSVDGDARAFDVKSLISWRGEWYVVHLSAIK